MKGLISEEEEREDNRVWTEINKPDVNMIDFEPVYTDVEEMVNNPCFRLSKEDGEISLLGYNPQHLQWEFIKEIKSLDNLLVTDWDMDRYVYSSYSNRQFNWGYDFVLNTDEELNYELDSTTDTKSPQEYFDVYCEAFYDKYGKAWETDVFGIL